MSDSRKTLPFFVGTYTMPAGHVKLGHGEGIYTCDLDLESGVITRRHVTGGMDNPSYLARDPAGPFLYVASESFEGLSRVMSYQIHGDGSLRLISNEPTHGGANCHVHCRGHRLYSASYGGGNLDVYVTDRGRLRHALLAEYRGSGPHQERQESAHAHQAMSSPDGKWLYVCDLGSDRIWRHRVDRMKEKPDGFAVVPPGSGPRHLVFHPRLPFAYVVCELTAQLLVCRYLPTAGELEIEQALPTIPPEIGGPPAAAAVRVHPTGQTLYFSNRGQNGVSIFSIEGNGKVNAAGFVASGGEHPRDLNVDPTGCYLLVANQDSDNITVYRLVPDIGLPAEEPVSQFECRTPTNIEF